MNDYYVTCNGNRGEVSIYGNNTVSIGGHKYEYSLAMINSHHYLLRIGNKTYSIAKAYDSGKSTTLLINGRYFTTVVQSKLEKIASEIIAKHQKQQHHSDITSPMPGMVLKIVKQPGDEVEIGDTVCILEAMKMENDIKSPYSGTIKELLIEEGKPVEKGAALFRIA